MPGTIPGLIALGFLLLVAALLGGNVNLFRPWIPPLRPRQQAVVALLGVLAIAFGVWLAVVGSKPPQPIYRAPAPPSAAPTESPTKAPSSTPASSPGATVPTPAAPSSPPAEVAYYLSDYDTVQTYGINVDTTPREVNGLMRYHPVAWYASGRADDPYWAEWDVSRKCVSFTSSGTGISDEAPSGSRYIFYVLTDGSDKWRRTVSLGQTYRVNVPMKGALRLRLSVAGLQNGYWGPYATWGDARVWCYSEPPNKK